MSFLVCLLNFATFNCIFNFPLSALAKVVSRQSPLFQEEFPRLAVGGDEKPEDIKKKEENKDVQYGPGPSLRPQSKLLYHLTMKSRLNISIVI